MLVAIYGGSAFYQIDVTKDFIENGCFCSGYEMEKEPILYDMMRAIEVGDIIYIKSSTPRAKGILYIKAIGIVTANKICTQTNLGNGIKVNWLQNYSDKFRKIELGHSCLHNMYENAMLHKEYSDEIKKQIVEWLAEK